MQKEVDFSKTQIHTKCLNTSESIKMRWRKRHREMGEDSRPKWGKGGGKLAGEQGRRTPVQGDPLGPEGNSGALSYVLF